jgi:hypothetical protein
MMTGFDLESSIVKSKPGFCVLSMRSPTQFEVPVRAVNTYRPAKFRYKALYPKGGSYPQLTRTIKAFTTGGEFFKTSADHLGSVSILPDHGGSFLGLTSSAPPAAGGGAPALSPLTIGPPASSPPPEGVPSPPPPYGVSSPPPPGEGVTGEGVTGESVPSPSPPSYWAPAAFCVTAKRVNLVNTKGSLAGK